MFGKVKAFLGAIATVIILFLFCKASTDLAEEARRVVGIDMYDYGYMDEGTDENMPMEWLIEQEIQRNCNRIEDMALRLATEIVREGGE